MLRMARELRSVSAKGLRSEVARIEEMVEKTYGFRPNLLDDITGLENNSFSDLRDPGRFEQYAYYPRRSGTGFFEPWPESLTTINGERPPADASRYIQGTARDLLDVDYQGMRYVIEVGNRAPNTRSVVHVHEKGGVTWVLDGGDMTVFARDIEPEVFREGERYYMPANTPMSANNLSAIDSMQLNMFVLPHGIPLATTLESW